jgi:hypothetical protein
MKQAKTSLDPVLQCSLISLCLRASCGGLNCLGACMPF